MNYFFMTKEGIKHRDELAAKLREDSDEAIGDGTPAEPEDDRDEPPELAQSDGEDNDKIMVYSPTSPDDSK